MDRGSDLRRTVLILAALALTACRSSEDVPPPAPPVTQAPPPVGSAALDKSVVITPPGRDVPRQYAAFSGVWVGSWDGASFDARLAVRTIAKNGRVEVTYAWGTLGDVKPGTADGQGKIAGNTMKLERFANGGDATFTMQTNGTLAGAYSLAGASYMGTFHKQ